MGDIRLHGEYERLRFVAIAENRFDGALTAQIRGVYAMHSVDDVHRSAIDEYGRQVGFRFGQEPDMGAVRSGEPGGDEMGQRAEGNELGRLPRHEIDGVSLELTVHEPSPCVQVQSFTKWHEKQEVDHLVPQ
ncbi:hypothetical protein [Streptomyces fumanus]|uniref:hypothetical protein n=1 Tax=Streptomyces fumanus TaxID=67302 RepID=UPI001E4DA51A|nr:hypothetical protein [Streptomyces fumanus]